MSGYYPLYVGAAYPASGGGGSGDMVLASVQTVTGAKTFNDSTLLLANVAGTFSSKFTNVNTAARTYTLPDAAGTIALTSNITGTNSGTNTGDQTITLTGAVTGSGTGSFVASLGSFTKSQLDTAVSDGNVMYVGDAPTAHNHDASAITTGTLSVARGGTGLTALGTPLQVLRTNAAGTANEYATITAGDALTSNPLSQFAATTSAQLRGVISDETGSGLLVFATSPTLTTPNIGVATGTSLSLSAALIGQNGTTPAGGIELYNTYTNASNYERMRIYFDTAQNAWTWADEKAGTGSNRGLIIRADSPLRFIIGGVASARIDAYNFQTSTFTNGFIANLDGVGAADRSPARVGGVWFTGGTSTTTKPQFNVEPVGTTSTGWSTSGTGIGVNAASGFTGNLIDAQVAGGSRFKVLASGSLVSTGNITASGSLQIGGGSTVQKILSATATLDFPSIASNDTHSLTMTVTGAIAGDAVFIGVPAALDANLIWQASVTAADTVTIRIHNASGASIDPASGTYRATVFQF